MHIQQTLNTQHYGKGSLFHCHVFFVCLFFFCASVIWLSPWHFGLKVIRTHLDVKRTRQVSLRWRTVAPRGQQRVPPTAWIPQTWTSPCVSLQQDLTVSQSPNTSTYTQMNDHYNFYCWLADTPALMACVTKITCICWCAEFYYSR